MSYDNPNVKGEYSLNQISLAAAATRVLRGPKGKRGLLRDVFVTATAAMTGSTKLQIGVAGNLGQFLDATLPNLAVNTGIAISSLTASNLPKMPDALNIPADTNILVTITPTGAAGSIDINVVLDFD